MKYTLIMSLLLLVSLSACVDSRSEQRQVDKIQKETGEALEVTGDFLKHETEEAKVALQEGIDDLDREIDRLQRESENAAEDARPEIEKQKRNLEEARQDAKHQLDKLGEATAENWAKIKKDFKDYRARNLKDRESQDADRVN